MPATTATSAPIASIHRSSAARAAINQANSQHSTVPRTPAGKQRSSLNALRHGLTAASAVLPSEDPAAYEDHRRRFFDEYQPATPTESQLVMEVADTAWRLNRLPSNSRTRSAHHTSSFPRRARPANPQPPIPARVRALPDKLREIQAARAERERRDLKDAAALLELHRHKGIPWAPADHGFVFSKDQVERFARRLWLLNQARHIEHVLFHGLPASLPIACHLPPTANSQSPPAPAGNFW